MRSIVLSFAFLTMSAGLALAQDEPDPDSAPAEEVVEHDPEVARAWAVPEGDQARTAEDAARESDSFARIHEADEELLELEAARRMVGYDLLDGVR